MPIDIDPITIICLLYLKHVFLYNFKQIFMIFKLQFNVVLKPIFYAIFYQFFLVSFD